MPTDQQRHVPVTPTRSAMRTTQLPRVTQLSHPSQITSVHQVPPIERAPLGPAHRPHQETTEAGPSPRALRAPGALVVHSSSPSVTNTPAGAGSEPDGSDRWLTDRIVTVSVGPEQKKWAVHAKLLCSKSKIFDDFFNTEEHQGQEIMYLPDEDPKLFALLVRWLYGTAFANSGGTRIFRFNPPDGRDITVRDYIGLYILGDKIQIMGVKNAAIDALYAYFGPDAEKVTDPTEVRHPDLRDIQYAFENTMPESHMRRLLIAHALFYLFGKKRRTSPLPAAWEEVISKNGEIAWAMVKMLSDWKWVMGSNVPDMKIKARQEFHEKPFAPPPASMLGPGGGVGGGDGQAIKSEPTGEEEA